MQSDVLIAGAGPTGLVLALWLAKLGVKVRIIDKNEGPGTTSRAVAVQARTLELYRQLDLDQTVMEAGHKVRAANLWVKGEIKAHIDFGGIGSGLTPYAFLQIFPQDAHEKLLIERLSGFGILVERHTELTAFTDNGTQVTAELRKADGSTESCEALYICGCDGAHSVVRQTIAPGFPGGTYQQIFYVADADTTGPASNGELHVDLDDADFLAVFPLAAEKRVRLIGAVRDQVQAGDAPLEFSDVSDRAMNHLKVQVEKVNWFSTYRVHHRVANHFRKGRAFLLGDAAHIHSPVGGQGMNTGIGDAINLAWKLAAVIGKRAPPSLLDSYEPERIAFARRLVSTTDRVFTFVSSPGSLANVVRTRIAPAFMATVMKLGFARSFLFRTVSQITLNYRGSPLSAGKAGRVQGGDRMPFVQFDGTDNFGSLASMKWLVQIYGTAKPDLMTWCNQRGISCEVFAWRDEHGAAGLARDAAYLLRPDSYVALSDATGSVEAIDRYCSERGLIFTA